MAKQAAKVAVAMRVERDVKKTIERLADQTRMTQTRVVEQAVRHAAKCWGEAVTMELLPRRRR